MNNTKQIGNSTRNSKEMCFLQTKMHQKHDIFFWILLMTKVIKKRGENLRTWLERKNGFGMAFETSKNC